MAVTADCSIVSVPIIQTMAQESNQDMATPYFRQGINSAKCWAAHVATMTRRRVWKPPLP